MVSFLQKTKPHREIPLQVKLPQGPHSLTKPGGAAFSPFPVTAPPSDPAPRPHCPAFWQHVRTSAENLQFRFSNLSPEPKMPSSGNKLNHNRAQGSAKSRKYPLPRERGTEKARRPSKQHGTQGACLKSRHSTQRSNYPQGNLDIKVRFLIPSTHWANYY